MALKNPLLQPVLIVVEWQIPVFRLPYLRLRPADGGVWVNELHWREVAAALLALVAVGVGVAAVRASAHDVSVGEKLLGLGVVILLRLFLHELAVVVKLAEEVGGELVVNLRCGAAVDVERDAELLERVLDDLVVTVAYVLRRYAFLLCPDGDRHSVLIASSDEDDRAFFEAQVAHVDIRGHIHAGQVAYVHATIGVRQCRRDGCPLEMFIFHVFCLIVF